MLLNRIILIFIIILIQSCSLLEKSEVHEQMHKELAEKGYDLSLTELKSRVNDILNKSSSLSFDSKMIILNTSGVRFSQAQDEIVDQLNDGFVYKNKIYESTPELGWDLLKADFAALKEKIISAKYHLIEDSKDKFIFSKDDRIYVGESISPQKSKLNIYQITRIVRPINLNIDWLNLIKGKKKILNITQSTVDMELSMPYKLQDRIAELSIYFKMFPEEGNSREAQLLKK